MHYTFSAVGKLRQVANEHGNTLQLTYSGATPSGLTDTAGRTWTIQTDGTGHITGVTDAASRTVGYQYSSAGDLIKVTDPLGHTTQFSYDGNHRLTGVTNANTHATSYAYDANGRATTVTDPASNVTALAYDTTNRKTTVTDPLGHAHTYTFDISNRVTAVTDPLLKTETATWNANNNRTASTNRNGATTSYTYDARGNVTLIMDSMNGRTAATFDAKNHPISHTDALNRTTSMAYDASGNVTSMTNAAAQTTAFTYDAKGQRLTATDANQHTTAYAYDSSGNLTSSTDALGHVTPRTYDAAGRVLSETDPDGRITRHTYDALGHVLTTTDGAGATTKATYDAMGNRTTSTDPLGHTTSSGYDKRDLLVTVTDPLGNIARTDYDAAGNKVKVTDPLGHAATFRYDANNQLASTTDANNSVTAYVYDNEGNQISITDPNNHTTTFVYDKLNQLTQVTDALGGRASYGYDAVGNRTSVTDPLNHVSTVVFDALNRPTSQTDPFTHTSAYGYDRVGNLLSKTDGNGTTTYSYDADNRLISAIYPEGSVTYTYDNIGDRISMTDPTGTTTYRYDGARRLTANVTPTATTAYAYDAAGNLTKLTYPGGSAVTYSYNALNRPTSIADWNGGTTSYAYDATGRKISAALPNGTKATYDYDAGNRLTSLQWKAPAGTSVANFTYTFDAAGNTTKIVTANGTSTFGYDELDRLTAANYPDRSSTSYAYDAAGNRTSVTSGGTTTAYSYDTNGRLTAVGSDKVQLDANGNVVQRGANSYTYDSQNRLLQVVTPSQSVQMGYDGVNHRVIKVAGGVSTGYAYSDHGPLARVVKESNSQRSQLYGLNGQVIWDNTSDQGKLYYHQDALGSTIAVTKADGSVAGTQTYDVFGAPKGTTTLPGSFWFAGEQYDSESSLIYLRARYYDPAMGRFLSADPAGPDYRDTQSLNPYVYARNNPLRFTDPEGHFLALVVGAFLEAFLVASTAITVSSNLSSASDSMDRYNKLSPEAKVDYGDVYIQQAQYDIFLAACSILCKIVKYLKYPEKALNTYGLYAKYVDTMSTMEPINTCPSLYNCPVDDPNRLRPVFTSEGLSSNASFSSTSQVQRTEGESVASAQQRSRPKMQNPGGAYVAPGSAPSKPANIAPSSGAPVTAGGFTLQWQGSGSTSQVSIFGPGNSNLYLQSDWISGTAFTPPALPWGTYSWSVRMKDSKGLVSSPSDAWTVAVGASADVWHARYFSDTNLGNQCTELFEGGTYVFHDWGTGAPGPTDNAGHHPCPADNFSARFTKTVHLKAGSYNFTLFSDDWGRLSVNSDLVVNNWQGAGQHYESRNLAEGDYTITVEYADTLGNAIIQAWWTGPEYAVPTETQDPNQWYATYWANEALWQDPVVKVNEGTGNLYHDWGNGSPGWSLPADQFSARFERTVNLVAGQYTFSVAQDDGARVFVDGTVIPGLDNWTLGSSSHSGTVNLASGPHVVRVEYFEDGGAARIGLNWALTSTNRSCTPSTAVSPTATATAAGATFDLGTGADGALTVSDTRTVNVVTSVSGLAGCSQLYAGAGAGFNAGDEVLVYQTQGVSAGTYEFRRLTAVNANVLTLDRPLDNTYGAGAAAQAIRVPNYTNVTIQAGGALAPPPWNGSSGGVLALRAKGKVDLQAGGLISADLAGFRGGAGWGSGDNATATQGEGVPGLGNQGTAANGNGGGASHAGGGESFAAGGGYGTSGTIGSGANCCFYAQPTQPGTAIGDAAITSLFFGGGGGGGNGTGAPTGGNGGGAVLIAANLINVGGTVSAQGQGGQPGISTASSHGGAGGAIRLQANTLSLAGGAITAIGGTGGTGTSTRGGDGAVGRVRFEYSVVQGTANVVPAASTNVVGTPAPSPQDTYGTGIDGPLVVIGTQTVNVWTSATGLAGSQQLAVGSSSGFAVGDEVLVQQTQAGQPGEYEFSRIASINGNTFTLTQGLAHTYGSSAQATRVPNFTTVTIQAGGILTEKAWDGSSGGILVFRTTGTLDIQAGGLISANAVGYRGGAGRGSGDNTTATQGEGAPGIGTQSTAANGNGGGAAHAGGGESPAAAGGYGTSGTIGSGANCCQHAQPTQPGTAIGNAALTSLFFGGGGGGHNVNNPGSPMGGTGGGAILILAKGTTVSGAITAQGQNGQPGVTTGSSHGGGGGAGGAILIRTDNLSFRNGAITAQGGNGGSGNSSTGGHGGAGRIRLVYGSTQGNATIDPPANLSAITPTPTVTPMATSTPSITATSTVQAGAIAVTGPLALSALSVAKGDSLTGSATLQNQGNTNVTLQRIVIAARPPGGTNAGGPFADFGSMSNVTIAPNQSVTIQNARTFTATDSLGQWYAYLTYQTVDGVYHDGRNVTFSVRAAAATTTPTSTSTAINTATGTLTTTRPLSLSASSVSGGGSLTASATLQNQSNASVTVQRIVIAGRPPGGTNAGGPFADFGDLSAVFLAPGQSITVQKTRTFTAADPLGSWYSYLTYQTVDGQWHDATKVPFSVVATPTFSSSVAVSPPTVAHGSTTVIGVTINDTMGSLANGIVDIEVFDALGTRAGQYYVTGQNWGAGQNTAYTWSWTTASTTGTYTVKIGVFGPGWSPTYYWNNSAATIVVN